MVNGLIVLMLMLDWFVVIWVYFDFVVSRGWVGCFFGVLDIAGCFVDCGLLAWRFLCVLFAGVCGLLLKCD